MVSRKAWSSLFSVFETKVSCFKFISVAVSVLKAVEEASVNISEVITTGRNWKKPETMYKE